MEVTILGAHNIETSEAKLSSFLVDGVLALDAGGLTSSLSLSGQRKIKAVLVTHHHFDHIRDLITLGMNAALWGQVKVFILKESFDIIFPCLLDGKIYVNFAEFPSKEKPSLQFCFVRPFKEEIIDGYRILPLPVKHPVPTIGYQVTSREGKCLFYTGDSGPGLSSCWQFISPQLLIIEVSGPNQWSERLQAVGHLSPEFLRQELLEFRRLKGYLPKVVIIHLPPFYEAEVKKEIEAIANELGVTLSLGYEGMKIIL